MNDKPAPAKPKVAPIQMPKFFGKPPAKPAPVTPAVKAEVKVEAKVAGVAEPKAPPKFETTTEAAPAVVIPSAKVDTPRVVIHEPQPKKKPVPTSVPVTSPVMQRIRREMEAGKRALKRRV